MTYFIRKKRFHFILAALLTLCLGTCSTAQAGTTYELYELIEGEPSENGYIPVYDPVEELTGETILPPEEDSAAPFAFSEGAVQTEPVQEEQGGNPFGDGEEGGNEGFSDGVPFSADAPEENEFQDGTGSETEPSQEVPAVLAEEDTVSCFSDESSSSQEFLKESSLPVRYSLPDVNGSTKVKDQGSLGICWAFSSLESIETGLIKKGLADSSLSLSETHLAYSAFHGKTDDPSDSTANETFLPINNSRWTRIGGNRYYSIATLARGYGPSYEKDYPLSLSFQADAADSPGSEKSILDSVITDQKKKASVSRLRNCYWLFEVNAASGSARVSRINDIKKFILNYGAVEIGLYTNGFQAPYDAETNSFYSPQTAAPNHSVTLIGWDDEKVTAASAPGAFLMQNSWGTDKGENGLFWVSYEDRSMKSPSFYEMESVPLGSSSNEILHQYDGTGYGSVIKPATPSSTMRISGANVFTADTAQYLKKVSFYASAAPISYTISVYRYVKSSPDTGVLVHTQNGSTAYAGYYTVDLTKQIPVASGEKFAMQLQFNHMNGFVPHERSSYRAFGALPGQSYLYNGSTWVDMTDLDYNCNICIKATGEKTNDKITIAPAKPAFQSVKVTGYTGITAKLSPDNGKADGCDFVLGTSSSFLKTKKYTQVKKNITGGTAVFSSLPRGTYYVAAHTYRLNSSGQKIFSSWSDVVRIQVTVGVPGTKSLSYAKVTRGNCIAAKVASSSGKVSGYDFALGKSSGFTRSGSYYRTARSITKTGTTFTYLPRGTYYAAVRPYNLTPAGKKILGKWSKPLKVTVSGITPGTPKFKSVKAGKGTLSVTYTRASSAYRYQYVLTKTSFSSTTLSPASRYKLYDGRKYEKLSLKKLKKGTYYLGVRAYTTKGTTRVYGKWAVKKVRIS